MPERDESSRSVKRRATALSPQDVFLLDQWGRQLAEAFDTTPYLVGSVLNGGTYRDVDVRMVSTEPMQPPKRQALNLAVTLWGRQVTGLPIDFQFQPAGAFAEQQGPRRPLGVDIRWPADNAPSVAPDRPGAATPASPPSPSMADGGAGLTTSGCPTAFCAAVVCPGVADHEGDAK